MAQGNSLIARFSGDYKDRDMPEILNLLRDVGISFTTSSASGISPELRYGPFVYEGKHEIMKFVDFAREGKLYSPRSGNEIVPDVLPPRILTCTRL